MERTKQAEGIRREVCGPRGKDENDVRVFCAILVKSVSYVCLIVKAISVLHTALEDSFYRLFLKLVRQSLSQSLVIIDSRSSIFFRNGSEENRFGWNFNLGISIHDLNVESTIPSRNFTIFDFFFLFFQTNFMIQSIYGGGGEGGGGV
jgi:hypothetical protein